MQTIKDLYNELEKLNSSIDNIIKASEYKEYNDLSGLKYDEADPETLLLKDELGAVMDKLEDINYTIDYLSRPIKSTGKLHKGSNGRYSFNNIELSSGYCIEALIPAILCVDGEWREGFRWFLSHIEHNGKDYIIVGYNGELEGLTVRVRERR